MEPQVLVRMVMKYIKILSFDYVRDLTPEKRSAGSRGVMNIDTVFGFRLDYVMYVFRPPHDI